MTNAELLAKIKAEIDKLYGKYKDKFLQCGDQYHLGLFDGLDMAKRVLDTIESEKLNDQVKEGEVILNGHGLLVDVTKWGDGYKLKVIIKEN